MKSKVVIILTLFIVLVSSCFKEEIVYYDIAEWQHKMIPYQLGQTITFIDTLGRSSDVHVTNDTTAYYDVLHITTPAYTQYTQYREIRLMSDKQDINITFEIFGTGRDIIVTFFDNWRSTLSHDEEGRFITFESNNRKQSLFDSLEINNTILYDVVEHNYYHYSTKKLMLHLLYNTTYGILHFEYEERVVYTLADL